MKPHPEIMPWFIGGFVGVWIALTVVGLWVTYVDKNIARKKRRIPRFIVGAGLVFAIFVLVTLPDVRVAMFFILAVALITFLNLRQFKVCSTCGKTIHSGMWFDKAEYCPKCGARLG